MSHYAYSLHFSNLLNLLHILVKTTYIQVQHSFTCCSKEVQTLSDQTKPQPHPPPDYHEPNFLKLQRAYNCDWVMSRHCLFSADN